MGDTTIANPVATSCTNVRRLSPKSNSTDSMIWSAFSGIGVMGGWASGIVYLLASSVARRMALVIFG